MAWPWPWWKKLTLLLHHFYKPDFLQFSSTRFGCQADTSWDISLWNISVASTLGREEEGHNWKLWIFVQIDTKTNRRQCDGIIYSFSPPWHLLGPAWGLSRGGELLWRADLNTGDPVLSQHCLTWFPNLHCAMVRVRTEAPVRQLRHAVGLLG